MFQELDYLPSGLLARDAGALHEVLPGPTLIHLPGRRPAPLFVSVLLHGNEDTGWRAIQALLQAQGAAPLPRALTLFIANVAAARAGVRFLPGQPDYNRVWGAGEASPERDMMHAITATMKRRDVFASVDIHNNTGLNPHYACVRRLEHRSLHLATLFGRTVVYFRKPDGVQTEAFADLCPAVTVECGLAGETGGVQHARDYVMACLRLAEIPSHPVPAHDIDLYRTVAIIKVPPDVSFGFDSDAVDIRFVDDLDRLNFRELPVATILGRVRSDRVRLEVHDERGRDVFAQFLRVRNGELVTIAPIMPSMFTVNPRAIRDDCLGYLMQRPANDDDSRVR